MRQFLLFGISGTLGFLVDAGVVSLLVHALEECDAVQPMLREIWRVMAPRSCTIRAISGPY